MQLIRAQSETVSSSNVPFTEINGGTGKTGKSDARFEPETKQQDQQGTFHCSIRCVHIVTFLINFVSFSYPTFHQMTDFDQYIFFIKANTTSFFFFKKFS